MRAVPPEPERSPLLGRLWLWLLCAALFFAPLLGGQTGGIGPAAARTLVAAAAVAWIIDRWGAWLMPRPAALLWLFAGWSAVTVAASNNLHASLMTLADLVTYAMAATMAADAGRDAPRRRAVLLTVLAGFTVVSGYGVYEGLINEPGWRVFGGFVNPNLFASYLVTVLPLAGFLALARAGGERPERGGRDALSVLAWTGLGLGLAALLYTGSKGAVLGLTLGVLLGAALTGVWRRVDLRRLAAAAVLLVAAVALGGQTLLGRVETATTTQAHSGAFRQYTWRGALHMAAENPVLGVGVGAFVSQFNRYAIAGYASHAHNAFLQAAAETGVPGLLLFLTALGSAALALWRRARHVDEAGSADGPEGVGDRPAPDAQRTVMAAAMLAGLLAAVAHNMVDFGWIVWGTSGTLWALVGLAVAGRPAAHVPVPRAAAVAALVPLLATLVGGIRVANAGLYAETAEAAVLDAPPAEVAATFGTARALDPLDAKLAIAQGRALLAAGEPAKAREAFSDAVRLSPGDPVAWRYLGDTHAALAEPERAIETYRRGLESSPTSYKLLIRLAQMEAAAGRDAEALEAYRRIIDVAEGPVGRYPATPELVPAEPILAYAAVAEAEEQAGNATAARRRWEALLEWADRYEVNREAYPMIWQATGSDDPEELARIRSLRERARAALTRVR